MTVRDGKPLTQQDLANRKCLGEGCDHRGEWIDQKCHPGKGQRVRYLHEAGVLIITCRSCKAYVATVAVQDEDALDACRQLVNASETKDAEELANGMASARAVVARAGVKP